MSSEEKILRIVYEKGPKAHIRAIAREAGFGIDYTRYILSALVKKGLLVASSEKDTFRISAKGRKRFEQPRVEKKPKVKRIAPKIHRKHLASASPAVAKQETKIVNLEEPPKIILAHNLNSSNEEKRLNVWSVIKKAAKYLSEISPEDKNPNN